jgi:excisionase family DNA binding protein
MDIAERLDRIERALEILLKRETVKDWYSTTEVAEMLEKSEYTVREWCRKGQVPAEKSPNGRGWLIANADLLRLRNGELPRPEHEIHRGVNGRRKQV